MPSGGPKKAGKAEWAGRRRPMTRTSGFSVRAAVQIDVVHVDGALLHGGHEMVYTFHLPDAAEGERVGFGGWFYSSGDIGAEVIGSPMRYVLTANPSPDWNKVGSQWVTEPDQVQRVELHLRAKGYGCCRVRSPMRNYRERVSHDDQARASSEHVELCS